MIGVWDVLKGLLSRVFGSKEKEKEHNPVSSSLSLKDRGLRSLQFWRLGGTYTASGECMKEDASPHFLPGEFLTLTRKEKDEKCWICWYCYGGRTKKPKATVIFFSFWGMPSCSGMHSPSPRCSRSGSSAVSLCNICCCSANRFCPSSACWQTSSGGSGAETVWRLMLWLGHVCFGQLCYKSNCREQRCWQCLMSAGIQNEPWLEPSARAS